MCKKAFFLISFLLVLGMTTSASAELVAYWTFDEGAGDTVFDSTGNGNDGTILGAQWGAGKFGNALEFNGSDQYVEVPTSNSLEIDENVSIAAWIKWVDAGDGWLCILANGQQNGPWENYGLFVNRGSRFLYFTLSLDGGHVTQSTPNDAVVPDEWLHATATWDGFNARIYVNGEMVLEQAQSGQLVPTQLPLRIGHRDGSSHFFSGIIDDVRVYNHTLIEEEILAAMEGGEGYPYALGPIPKDGALHSDTWASISWRAGDYAVSHDVYIGDNFDDVDNGAESTFQGNQADTFFVAGFPGFPFPDGLVPGTTYYWRIDEVNDTEPNSPWKGDVWSFSIPPKTAYFPDPADGAESVGVDAELSWTSGFGAKLHTVYFGETFEEVDNAASGQAQGTTTFAPGTLKMARTYYWRIDEFDVVETHKGNVWSFTTEGAVGNSNPANGAVDVTQTPVLTWLPGLGASPDVYSGADSASLELKGSGNLGSESYDPGELAWDTTYYWRINEANNANADSPWTGPLWSFTTANFLIIDDMEAYNDLDPADPASNRIFLAWIDG
ncbi:MAG: LamG domain-containing protein, partial [Planctomycetes bacterium]|nr:LamG domain-containing protein [Planctomycetota bacterium]